MNKIFSGSFLPITTVILFIFALWYVGTVVLNSPFQKDVYKRKGVDNYTYSQLIKDTMSQKRPVLPPFVYGSIKSTTFIPVSKTSLDVLKSLCSGALR